jgi:RNA ligase
MGSVTEVKLGDLLDEQELAKAIEDGFVRRQVHPTQPLAILNYTERTTWERAWTDVTRQCRGLIHDTRTGAVVARPFRKFFNHGEDPVALLDLHEPVTITDKMDGSMGALYRGTDGCFAIATRGSFASEQALHATAVFRQRYEAAFAGLVNEAWTYIFEIVYRANRVVVDYGETDDLFYLGRVHIASGRTESANAGAVRWPGPQAFTFSGRTFADALDMPPRDNAEGIVVHFQRSDTRVKLKLETYVLLHRLITGMNARVVWERIGEGETADQICAGIPEEFWPWVREVGGELVREKNRVIDEATAEHERILAALPEGWTRKDYALAAMQSPLRAWLFNLLDGRDPSAGIWRTLKPSGERTLVAYSEDTA